MGRRAALRRLGVFVVVLATAVVAGWFACSPAEQAVLSALAESGMPYPGKIAAVKLTRPGRRTSCIACG